MASASNHQRDIDTETISRAIEKIQAGQRQPSGEHQAPPCKDHESRILSLEKSKDELKATISEHDKRLHAGDIGFVQIRADIHALTKAVNDAVAQMKIQAGVCWPHEILRAVINWGVPAAIVILVWALAGSGVVAIKGNQ